MISIKEGLPNITNNFVTLIVACVGLMLMQLEPKDFTIVCSAMFNGKCKLCNHMWDQHMHLRYELKVVTKQFIDDKVRKKMAGVASEKERMVIYKKNLDVKISELQREHDDLIKMSA